MQLSKSSDQSCPSNAIAVAIHKNRKAQHCGIVFTNLGGQTVLCDVLFDNLLRVEVLAPDFYWTEVQLDPWEVDQLSSFIQMVIDQHKLWGSRLDYSLLYTVNSFNVAGQLRSGAGVTCATFVAYIFERFAIPLVDISTWKKRPKKDAEFKSRLIAGARQRGWPEALLDTGS